MATTQNDSDSLYVDSYKQKDLLVSIVLDESGNKTEYSFPKFATTVSVNKTGTPDKPKASVTLKGLSLETMTALTRLGFGPTGRRKNLIKIEAGLADKALSVVFKGEIVSAWADFNSAPSIEFKIEAISGSYPQLIPQGPMTVSGSQSASDVIKGICKDIGYTLENNEVTQAVKNCIIEGDPIGKIRKIAGQIGCDLIIDDDQVVLIRKGSVRKEKGGIPLISAKTGMIGYPTFDDKGIQVSCFFNPNLRIGAKVKVESVVPHATGEWKIVSLSHALSANDPGSHQWKTSFNAVYLAS